MIDLKEKIQNASKKAGEKKMTVIIVTLLALVAINAIVSIVTSIINF